MSGIICFTLTITFIVVVSGFVDKDHNNPPVRSVEFVPDVDDGYEYRRSLLPYNVNGFVDRHAHNPPKRSVEFEGLDGGYRFKRSLQPGAPNNPNNENEQGWKLDPSIGRGSDGNTRTNVEIQHKGDDHEFNAGWGKVVDGPGRAKPVWHAGGSIRW